MARIEGESADDRGRTLRQAPFIKDASRERNRCGSTFTGIKRADSAPSRLHAAPLNREWARFREYLHDNRRSLRTVFHETTRKVSLLRQSPLGRSD